MSRAGRIGLVLALVVLVGGAVLAWVRVPLAEHFVARADRLDRGPDQEAGRNASRRALGLAKLLAPRAPGTRLLEARRLRLDGDFQGSQAILATIDEDALDAHQRLDGLTSWAINALQMSHLDDAQARFGEALEIARTVGDVEAEIKLHTEIGRMGFYFTHDYPLSRENLERAVELAEGTGFESLHAKANLLLGHLLWWWNQDLDSPLPDYYKPALEVFRRVGDQHGEAETLHRIAFFHASDGNLLEFFKYLDLSIALREDLDDRAGLANEYVSLGWAYLRLHDYGRARRYLEKSIEVNADRGDLFAYLRSQRLLADCEMRQGFVDEAEQRLWRAIEREEPGGAPEDPFLWAHLGEIARYRDRPIEAQRYFEKALSLSERQSLGARNRVWMLAGLSYSFTATGSYERATEILAEMEKIVARTNHSGSIRRLELERAALAEAQGKSREAFNARLDAERIHLRSVASAPTASDTTSRTHEWLLANLLTTAIEPDLPALIDGDRADHAELAFDLLEQRSYGFYRDLVVLSVGRKRRHSPAREAALHALRETTRLAEMRGVTVSKETVREAYGNYEDVLLRQALSDDDYLALRRVRPLALGEVQERLDPTTALVQFALARNKAFALILRNDGLSVVPLPVERRILPAKISLLRSLALDPEKPESERWRPVARELFRLLIAPIRQTGKLDGVEKLGFIPYGELHDVPYAALLDPTRERFLVEDFDLFLLPAASLIDSSAATDALRDEVFAVAIEKFRDAAPLSYASHEAEMAVATLGGRAVLEDQATETSFKKAGGDYRFLHLATHGISEPQMPLLSHIVLRPSADDDGKLTVSEIIALEMRADLVVLAGCQTGLSFSPNGSRRWPVGRLGLIQAFLHSGADSVLASLAPVSDAGTLAFMEAFYAGLSSSDRVSALAQVQRSMAAGQLEHDGFETPLSHPRHWAPFILVGAHS